MNNDINSLTAYIVEVEFWKAGETNRSVFLSLAAPFTGAGIAAELVRPMLYAPAEFGQWVNDGQCEESLYVMVLSDVSALTIRDAVRSAGWRCKGVELLDVPTCEAARWSYSDLSAYWQAESDAQDWS